MVEKIKVPMWDVLTFFVTGVIIITNIKFYFADAISAFVCPGYIKSEFILVGYVIILAYVLGASFEPLSNFIFKFLDSFYLKFLWDKVHVKFPWNKKLRGLTESIDKAYKPSAQDIIKTKYGIDDSSPYNFAKDYILHEEVPCVFMQFLSKFGFYRNLSILVLVNTAYLSFSRFNGLSLKYWFFVFFGLFLHHLFYYRAKSFYLYTGNVVYTNFIIAHKK